MGCVFIDFCLDGVGSWLGSECDIIRSVFYFFTVDGSFVCGIGLVGEMGDFGSFFATNGECFGFVSHHIGSFGCFGNSDTAGCSCCLVDTFL